MPDLPRPRDREEMTIPLRTVMVRTPDGRPGIQVVGSFPGGQQFVATTRWLSDDEIASLSAVPPVSGMPELAHPCRVLDGNGVSVSADDDRESAEAERRRLLDREKYPNIPGPLRVVRLAVVEVVEPEPEAAPSGWRYEAKEDRSTGRRYLWIGDAKGRLISTTASTDNVPPIDRAYVARLLEARDG